MIGGGGGASPPNAASLLALPDSFRQSIVPTARLLRAEGWALGSSPRVTVGVAAVVRRHEYINPQNGIRMRRGYAECVWGHQSMEHIRGIGKLRKFSDSLSLSRFSLWRRFA